MNAPAEPARPPGAAPRRILAIQLRRLGDLVLATPALRALKTAWPACRLSLVTESPFHEILAGNPHVDEVILHPRGVLRSLAAGFDLRRRCFDLAIDFHGNPTSARLAAQSAAPIRVGWALRGRSLAYTAPVPVPPATPPRYAADQKLDLVRALGAAAAEAWPEIFPAAIDETAARRLAGAAGLPEGEAYLAVAPFSRRAYKRWPAAAFAEVIRAFRVRIEAPVLLVGGPGETPWLAAVNAALAGSPLPMICADSVPGMLGLLRGARVFFGLDGGAKHLAQALAVPTLALFGPQSPAVWTLPSPDDIHRTFGGRPPDCAERCSRWKRPCACLGRIRPSEVSGALVELWNSCRPAVGSLPAGRHR